MLNVSAKAPMGYKTNSILSGLHRAWSHCSDWVLLHNAIERIRTRCQSNGYPTHLVDLIICNFINRKVYTLGHNSHSSISKSRQILSTITLQWRGVHSNHFKRKLLSICNTIDVFFATKKLSSVLRLHGVLDVGLQSNVVYKFICPGCSSCYIGKTYRHLCTRIDEHRRNKLFQHFSNCVSDTSTFSNNFQVIDRFNTRYGLLVLEELHIRRSRPSLNVVFSDDTCQHVDLKLAIF